MLIKADTANEAIKKAILCPTDRVVAYAIESRPSSCPGHYYDHVTDVVGFAAGDADCDEIRCWFYGHEDAARHFELQTVESDEHPF